MDFIIEQNFIWREAVNNEASEIKRRYKEDSDSQFMACEALFEQWSDIQSKIMKSSL
jgi:hypothetical protein